MSISATSTSVTNPSRPLMPRVGMMAVIRNRRALITAVFPHGAEEKGLFHLVEVEYTDGIGAESERLLWEVELEPEVLEPSALPDIDGCPPMEPREFDAMLRAARWSALTPSLPFSGLDEDRPPVASPLFGAIQPEAYQLVPVLRALEMPRVALMLADAVGLGKTIQAGMVLRELMLRRRIRRVLILCPAALRTQWRDELNEKFSLPFEVVDRPRTLQLQREHGLDANPWRIHERIIASYHYAKQPEVLEQLRALADPREGEAMRWDLLIVDEAHNLAPSSFGDDSDLSRMLQRIAPWFEHRIFLTATPHNGHTRSFSGLLEILDPIRFTRKSSLNAEDRRRIGDTVIRRLKREINLSYQRMHEPPRFAERVVEGRLVRFGRLERRLDDAFRDFRRQLRRSATRTSGAEKLATTFAAEVLQKRLLSGPWAFGQSWRTLLDALGLDPSPPEALVRVRAALQEDTDNDAERESRLRQADRTVGAWLRAHLPEVQDALHEVTLAVEALGITRLDPSLSREDRAKTLRELTPRVQADARYKSLEALLEEKLRTPSGWREDERFVIFTEYLTTLDYLKTRLEAHFGGGPWLVTLFGGMNDSERDTVKRLFNEPNSPARVLLATDAAGEGLNLQRACRYMLHYDIPWNPARMEQRNGRLDRHGQERDVLLYHFDSHDDASMRFLGKVLQKRSQTREDRVVTDEIFSRALLAHFEHDEEAEAVDNQLDRDIRLLTRRPNDAGDELPTGAPLPGQADQARLEALRAELDLSPESLRETLETALAIDAGRPRLKEDASHRFRFVPLPGGDIVPTPWQDVVNQTLRAGGPQGSLLALVFDPSHYVQQHSGRAIFRPEPDSCLLHLGHALYHRVLSLFARFRFPRGPQAATRWCVRSGPVPSPFDALVLLTVEELAVNELRETCHHVVRTLVFPVLDGLLQEPLPHQPPAAYATQLGPGNLSAARLLWNDLERPLKSRVQQLKMEGTEQLQRRLEHAQKRVTERETQRFRQRARELSQALQENKLEALRKEADELRLKTQQLALFRELDDDLRRRLSDLNAELQLREQHYQSVLTRLEQERERTLQHILPRRYALRGQLQVYPITVELRLPSESSCVVPAALTQQDQRGGAA